jgi:hypothetical protein
MVYKSGVFGREVPFEGAVWAVADHVFEDTAQASEVND